MKNVILFILGSFGTDPASSIAPPYPQHKRGLSTEALQLQEMAMELEEAAKKEIEDDLPF